MPEETIVELIQHLQRISLQQEQLNQEQARVLRKLDEAVRKGAQPPVAPIPPKATHPRYAARGGTDAQHKGTPWKPGDEVFITNRITIPKKERGKRLPNRGDREAIIQGFELVYDNETKVHITTKNQQDTWRLAKNLNWVRKKT